MRYSQGYGSGGGSFGRGILDEFKNAFKRTDNGLIQIIMINLAVFIGFIILRVLLVLGNGSAFYQLLISQFMLPASIPEFLHRPWTLITYFFLHEGFLHILFNMLFLYWFGRIVKEYLGGTKVVSLYVLGGIVGGLFYLLIYNTIPFFAGRVDGSVMLGASAGVFAVVVGAATLLPDYTMFLMFIGPVRIKYIALFYILLSFAQTTGMNAGGNLAHLGGAALGYLYIGQLQKGRDWGSWIFAIMAFFKSFFKKQPKVKVSYRRKTSGTSAKRTKKQGQDISSQDEIDAILDKISQSGYESLTKDEKQKLFNASKK